MATAMISRVATLTNHTYTALEVNADLIVSVRRHFLSFGRCSNFNRGEDLMKKEMVVQTSIEEGILFLEM